MTEMLNLKQGHHQQENFVQALLASSMLAFRFAALLLNSELKYFSAYTEVERRRKTASAPCPMPTRSAGEIVWSFGAVDPARENRFPKHGDRGRVRRIVLGDALSPRHALAG